MEKNILLQIISVSFTMFCNNFEIIYPSPKNFADTVLERQLLGHNSLHKILINDNIIKYSHNNIDINVLQLNVYLKFFFKYI